MNRILAVLVTLYLAGAARAGDPTKPNTLTPKEVAEGWILLFDGETTFGWQTGLGVKELKHDVAVRDGMLILSGQDTAVLCTTQFRYFEIRFECRTEGEQGDAPSADAGFVVHTPGDGKVPGLTNGFGFGALGKQIWGQVMARLTPDGCTFVRHDDPSAKPFEFKGKLGQQYGLSDLRFDAPHIKNARLYLRNIKLRPLQMQAIFNGKDLAGWKKFEGDKARAKSMFGVNQAGELTVKDGPGDLQTEGQWADFLLQIECKTNGKHLNSGVFFRCLPGQYQNGYEAQIHNGWTDKADKEYTVEEFDPKTHALTGKNKIKSAALDYGTGAIYRRVPARKGVAKDHEWFTMTVVAQGRHIATWVNGVQVVDWIDNRPLQENPRNGCRLDKGAISLQGHDPTTDLSFRNIRLAELTKKG
jgi:hypothetical protein